MRSFDERMDEIRRRSEIMLKMQQRNRRGMLLTVIPAVLCAVICLAAIQPGSKRSQDSLTDPCDTIADIEQAPEMHMENYSASIQSITAIQVTGKGVDKCIDDPTVLKKVCRLFDAVTESTPNFSTAGAPTGGTGEVYGDGRGKNDADGKAQSQDHYILAFSDGNGIVRQYRLNNTVLTELTTGETDFLRKDDLMQLSGLLGLSAE